jgi:RHS repeat-associated protein
MAPSVPNREDAKPSTIYHTDGLGSVRALTDIVGLVTDRYTYDAFGAVLNHTGTFGNAFGFAGEQQDATGMNYLRARYYDPSIGRFISKDAFNGFFSDPYSQHDYQYAHGNPVRFTDPSGYFSIGEIAATLSMLAIRVSLNFSVVMIGAGILAGADADDIRTMFSDYGAGFADGVSGGYLPDLYNYYTGQKVEPRFGALYRAGQAAGVGVSILTGMRFAYMATTAIGAMKWVGIVGFATDLAMDLYGAATGSRNLYNSWQEDGKLEIEDSWNLLSYLPFLGAIKGVKQFFGANRAAKAGPGGSALGTDASDVRTKVTAGEPKCFTAGTEIATAEGIKNIEDIQVGDWVLVDDPTTEGVVEYRQVTNTIVRATDELFDITVDGEVISTTDEHPFWVVDIGWVEAEDLQVGMRLLTKNGNIVDVDQIDRREGEFTVYNFAVEGIPTYFVSDLGLLVHNALCFYDELGGFSTVSKPDAAADALAQKLGGKSRQKFNSDPDGREFDAISDEYIGQAKPSGLVVNRKFRVQAKATFEAAQATNRKVYYEFAGPPDPSVIAKLQEYSLRYNVPLVIDIL